MGMPDQSHRAPYQWQQIKLAWQHWLASGKEPWPTLEQFAAAHEVPYWTLVKHTGAWTHERKAELKALAEAQADVLTAETVHNTGPARHHVAGSSKADGLSAGSLRVSPPAQAHLGQLQQTHKRIVENAGLAADALLDEVLNGKGAARIGASKELLSLAGLLKPSENKAETTPYQEMTHEEIRERVTTLFPRALGVDLEGGAG